MTTTKALQMLYEKLFYGQKAKNSAAKIFSDVAAQVPSLPTGDGDYYLTVNDGEYSFTKKS